LLTHTLRVGDQIDLGGDVCLTLLAVLDGRAIFGVGPVRRCAGRGRLPRHW
jgi:hypothetical protein